MTDDQQAIRDRILVAALAHVAFDGWTQRTLKAGVKDAGMSQDMALRAFAGGIPDLVDHWADWADRRMLDDLAAQDLAAMRIRDRITAAVKARLQVMDHHPEAARRLFAYLSLPPNAPLAARLTWRTVDVMWYAAGDDASDFNYYTKRGLLAPVYTTTALYWLADTSDGHADTWAYLDRRIADVMKVPAIMSRIKAALSSLPRPSRIFRRARN